MNISATCRMCGSGYSGPVATPEIKELKDTGICTTCYDSLVGDEI